MGGLTKEELLDVKNIKLLKEIKGAFDNENELHLLARYVAKSYKLVPLCQIERSNIFPRAKWSTTVMLVNIIEMMKKGKIIFKE
jgi:hypothetical protein